MSNSTNNCNNGKNNYCVSPEQLILAAAAISLAITTGRTANELETLLNLLSLIRENTQRVLAQKLVCARDQTDLDVGI